MANREGGLLEGGTRLTANETPVYHHMGLSAFAEYAVVSETSVVPMPDDIPFDVGALFGCGVMCGAGTVLNTAGIKAGDSVAIVGAGGVGSSAILGAELAGAREIFVLDKDPKKLSFASQLGATQVINNDDDKAFEKVVELSKGGVDYAFETAGTLGAFESAYHSTRRGGTVVALGLVDPQTTFSLDIAALVTGAKAVKGSYIGSCNPMIHIPQYMELYRKGRFPVDKLISHHLPLEDINIALDRMNKGDALRQIIDFQ